MQQGDEQKRMTDYDISADQTCLAAAFTLDGGSNKFKTPNIDANRNKKSFSITKIRRIFPLPKIFILKEVR